MVHFFAPAGRKEDSVLDVEIRGARRRPGSRMDDWTMLLRRFVVSPNPDGAAPVLHTENEKTGAGRLLFLPLGADLAPGRFDIVFTPGKGTTGYLIFSKITLGVGEKRTVFRDAAMSETE